MNKAIISAALILVIGVAAVLLLTHGSTGIPQTAAAVPLNSNTVKTTAVLQQLPSDSISTDTFIGQIPTIITQLQAISKDPEAFKTKVQQANQSGRFPYINPAIFFGYWSQTGTFTTSGNGTCGNSYVPAHNEMVTEAGPGTCIAWTWTLYSWFTPATPSGPSTPLSGR